MQPREYERMAEVEDTHWWYRGTRDLIARLMRQRRPKIPWNVRALDAGCGTGANLQLLREVLQPKELLGFDLSERAVAYSQIKEPTALVSVGDLCDPPLLPHDLLLCVDVLYMTGLQAGAAGLQTLLGQMSSGGWVILHVPAYDWLFSRHDVAVGTRQRFVLGDIRRLITELGLTIDLLTYRMSLLFPLVVLSRWRSLLYGAKHGEAGESDLKLPTSWLNACLLRVVHLENWLIAHGVRFPCGSSIIALGRKP